MVDLKLDETTHDLTFENNDLARIGATDDEQDKLEEVAQSVKIAFKTQLGEWMMDTEAGFPYLQQAFVDNPDMGALQAWVRAVATSVEGVDRVDKVELSIDRTTRKLSGYAEVRTIYGPTVITIP